MRQATQRMSTHAPSETDPQRGLYLQNRPGYIGDLATPEILVEYAVVAEDAGWDGVFLSDGLTPQFKSIDPWITFAGIATETSTITLGSWITPVCRRKPWQIAQDLATLDHLSDGRVLLGAGLGVEENYTMFGEPWKPTELGLQYDEALDIIDGLWRGDPLSYDGEFYSTDEAELPLTPVQEPRIPIVLACWWPNKKPYQRATEWDGIMPAAPAFFGEEGQQGEPITGSPEEELRALLAYYYGLTDDPGEVIVPIDTPNAPPDFADTCRDLGATWLLTSSLLEPDHDANLKRIRAGPPV